MGTQDALLGETKQQQQRHTTRTGCFTSKYVVLGYLILLTAVLAAVCYVPYFVNLDPDTPFPGVWPTTNCTVRKTEIIGNSKVIYTVSYLGMNSTITFGCGKYGCSASRFDGHTYTCAYDPNNKNHVYFEDQLEQSRDGIITFGSVTFGVFSGTMWLMAILIMVMRSCVKKKNENSYSSSHFFGNDVNKIPRAYRDLVLQDFEGNESVLWIGEVDKDIRSKILGVYLFIAMILPLQFFIMGMVMKTYNLALFIALAPFLLIPGIYVANIRNYNIITNRRVLACKSAIGIVSTTGLEYQHITRMTVSSSLDIDHLSVVSVGNNNIGIFFPKIADNYTVESLIVKYLHKDQVVAMLGDKAKSYHSASSDCSYREWYRPAPLPLSELQNAHIPVTYRSAVNSNNIQSTSDTSNRRYIKLHRVDLVKYDTAYPTELLGIMGHHEYISMIHGINAEIDRNAMKLCGSKALAMIVFFISFFLIIPLFFMLYWSVQRQKKNNAYTEQLNSNVLQARKLKLVSMVFGHGKQAVSSLVIAVDA